MWTDKHPPWLDWAKTEDKAVLRLEGVHRKYKDTERMKLKDVEKALPCKY